MSKKKDKILKKLTTLVINEFDRRMSPSIAKSQTNDDYIWSEFDQDVSDKFKKMFMGMLNYKNNLRFEINDHLISISTEDITSIKSSSSNRINAKYCEENYVKLEITKTGFEINHGYSKRSYYKDPNMYNDLIDDIKLVIKKINNDNFQDIWSNIMKESGVARDNNLNDLIDE